MVTPQARLMVSDFDFAAVLALSKGYAGWSKHSESPQMIEFSQTSRSRFFLAQNELLSYLTDNSNLLYNTKKF